MKLSVVATLYRSGASVEEFVRRASAAARKQTEDYEILLVDDGSPDRSLETALELRKSEPKLSVVELSRNFGHHKAMMTGLEHARGDKVFLIDVDLEEPPELVAVFSEEMDRTGCDVVYGVQRDRTGGLVKRLGGAAAWWLAKRLLSIPVPRNHSTARLMTKQYVDALVKHKEHSTAIGGLWVLTGFRQTGVVFDRDSRKRSSYSTLSRARVFLDSMTSFSERPLYAVFFLGCGMFIVSLLAAAWLIVRRVTGTVLSGWASLMVSVWGLSGLILLCLGLVGLYVSRIFIETKNRPYVIVKKVHR